MNIGRKTNEEARTYFKECGIAYDTICGNEILLLSKYIKKELLEFNGSNGIEMTLSKKIIVKEKNGALIEAFLEVSGSHFKKREAISFNDDGFIGFAGWASSNNTKPFIDAFIKWCDFLKMEREAE